MDLGSVENAPVLDPDRKAPDAPDKRSINSVVKSATAGTFVEFYDFAIYGALAPVLARVFFPSEDAITGLLSTFAVFAVAFAARPLGGFIWGPVGDRIGRKNTLSILILLISVATVLIGLLPSANSIGIVAPISLIVLRLVQGLSAGGENSGAAVFIAEHAPDKKRAYLTSWLHVATTSALISGILVVALLTAVLPPEAMEAWGWRIPFLLAGPLGLIGLYIRLKVDETPSFKKLSTEKLARENPFSELSKHPGWLKGIGITAAFLMPTQVSFYMLLTYMPVYLKTSLGYTGAAALGIIVCAGAAQITLVPLFGRLSDRIGRPLVLRLATFGFILLTYPAFLLLNSHNITMAFAGLILLAIPTAAALGNCQTPGLEQFPTAIRYTATAMTLGVLTALFAGTAAYVSTWLTGLTGSPFAPAGYLILTVIPSFIVSFKVRDTARQPMPD